MENQYYIQTINPNQLKLSEKAKLLQCKKHHFNISSFNNTPQMKADESLICEDCPKKGLQLLSIHEAQNILHERWNKCALEFNNFMKKLDFQSKIELLKSHIQHLEQRMINLVKDKILQLNRILDKIQTNLLNEIYKHKCQLKLLPTIEKLSNNQQIDITDMENISQYLNEASEFELHQKINKEYFLKLGKKLDVIKEQFEPYKFVKKIPLGKCEEVLAITQNEESKLIAILDVRQNLFNIVLLDGTNYKYINHYKYNQVFQDIDVIEGHIQISNDSKYVAAKIEENVLLLKVQNLELLYKMEPLLITNQLLFTINSKNLIFNLFYSEKLVLWSIEEQKEIDYLKYESNIIIGKTKNILVLGYQSGVISVMNLDNSKFELINQIQINKIQISLVQFDSKQKLMAIISKSNLSIWNCNSLFIKEDPQPLQQIEFFLDTHQLQLDTEFLFISGLDNGKITILILTIDNLYIAQRIEYTELIWRINQVGQLFFSNNNTLLRIYDNQVLDVYTKQYKIY